MKYCIKCLETDTRPNTKIDSTGICFACQNFKKDFVKYDEGFLYEYLDKMIKLHPRKKNNKYDCVIGVSGGKDSLRQAIWVRDKLNLIPLLVCAPYSPEQITKAGADNLSNLINHGFDLIVTGPAPETWKKILKKGFYSGNYIRGPELVLQSCVPAAAIKNDIELIFWGESPASIWNDKKTKAKDEFDGNFLRNLNTLNNCDTSWMLDQIDHKSKLIPYTYPDVIEFKKKKLQIIFLNPFLHDWSYINNAKFAVANGLKVRNINPEHDGDLYGITSIDDTWVPINQMIKFYKYGFGRASDYINFEIRNGNITRHQGINILEKYDGTCSQKLINNFCKYIQISKDAFWSQIAKYVNKDLFTANNQRSKKYKRKFKVGYGII